MERRNHACTQINIKRRRKRRGGGSRGKLDEMSDKLGLGYFCVYNIPLKINLVWLFWFLIEKIKSNGKSN